MTIDKSMIKRLVAQTFPDGGDNYFDYEEEFDAFARAIEAAVLAEKQEHCVCGEPSANTVHRTDGPCYQQEPVKDEPVAWMVVTPYDKLIFQNASQAEYYAEKWEIVSAPIYTRPQPDLQAPVKGEPVAWMAKDGCMLLEEDRESNADARFLRNWKPLYTRPQPDLTAEVERLKLSAEHWNRLYREKCQEFHDAQANKGKEIVWLIDRIAALEGAAREAREAFEQHDGNYKLSKASGAVVEAATAKLDAVLGNAEITGG